jgi:hypothetical protein
VPGSGDGPAPAPWCRPRVASRARLMALARARMSVRMRGRPAAGLRGGPGAAGEVADLAFHHGAMCPVVLLPGRIPLARFGVLQRGFMGVDADHPSPTGFRARRPQWARTAELAEAGLPVAAAGPDGHGVASRAGDRAGGQIDAEPVFGIAVGVAHEGTLVRMSWPRRVCSSRVAPSARPNPRTPQNLSNPSRPLNRYCCPRRVGGRCAGGGLVQQLVDDLAVGGVGRGDGHVGDQLVVGIDPQLVL